MSELNTSVVVDLKGNLLRRSRQYSQAMGNFSRAGQKHMSRLSSVASKTGRMLDRAGNRYTGMLTGAAAVGSVKMVMNIEERFTRLGIQANKSADEMSALKNEIYDTAQSPDIRVNPDQIISAVESIVEKTGDLQFAKDNIRNIGLAIQATGAAGGSIGEILAEFQKMDIKVPDQVLQAIDTLNKQGKEGAFTLKNLAALGPRVITAYTSMGRGGIQGLKELGAALQVIRQGTGSSEQAATAFEALLRTLGDSKKAKLLQDGGITIFDAEALKQGKEVLLPINEIMIDIIKKTGGKKTMLSKVFDAEAVRAFNAASSEFQRTGNVESLSKFMAVHGDGTTTLNDSARAAKNANAAMTSLYTAWKKFADNKLTGPIQTAADILNDVGSDNTDSVIGTALTAGAVAYGGRKLYKGGKWARGRFGRSAAKAAKPGLSSLMGYKKSSPSLVKQMAPHAMKAGRFLGPLAAAGGVGYGIGSLANKYLIDGTAFGDAIGRSIANVMAAFGNQKAQIALEIDSKGNANVKSMQSDNMELSVDSGMVMP